MSPDALKFEQVAALGEALERTTKRLDKTRLIAELLQRAAPEEVAPAVRLIIGQVFAPADPRILDLSSSAVWRAVEPVARTLAPEEVAPIQAEARDFGDIIRGVWEAAGRGRGEAPLLTLLEVYRSFEEMAAGAGPGSRARRDQQTAALLERAEPAEAEHLAKNLTGEMRHGVNEGLMVDAVARAAGVSADDVRRALMLAGDLGAVAQQAMAGGCDALRGISVQLFVQMLPMLADTAGTVAEALERHGPGLSLEHKLDGARVQIHRRGDQVCIYSRTLSDVTASLPDVCREVLAGAAAQEAIFDGEAVAVGSDGRPLPFQEVMRRRGREREIETAMAATPMRLLLFDLLYADGHPLIDRPYRERTAALELAADLRKAVDGNATLKERLEAGRVALTTFTLISIPSQAVAQDVTEDLTTAMIKEGFNLVERGQLDRVLKELKIQSMGLVDPQTAQEIGKLSGCEVILLGSISDRGASAVINARLMETTTGRSLVAERLQVQKTPISRK